MLGHSAPISAERGFMWQNSTQHFASTAEGKVKILNILIYLSLNRTHNLSRLKLPVFATAPRLTTNIFLILT